MNAQDFITEKYEANNWDFYPPSRQLVAEWLDEYAKKYHTEQCNIANVSTRTFRFSGINKARKFVREIQAVDRESAIAEFELTYPDLTWRTSTELD